MLMGINESGKFHDLYDPLIQEIEDDNFLQNKRNREV